MQKGCDCEISDCAISFDSGLFLLSFFILCIARPNFTTPLSRGFSFPVCRPIRTTIRQKNIWRPMRCNLYPFLIRISYRSPKNCPAGTKRREKSTRKSLRLVMCCAMLKLQRGFLLTHLLFLSPSTYPATMHITSDCNQSGQQYHYPLNFDEVSP